MSRFNGCAAASLMVACALFSFPMEAWSEAEVGLVENAVGAVCDGAERSGPCAWQAGFHMQDLDGWAYASAVYDDGTGPALYVGGWFTNAGGVLVNNIAKWDGSSWSGLTGPSGTGVGALVRSVAVYDDGSGPALYAGGSFASAGGVTVNHIARWDGSAWTGLSGPSDTGTNGGVYALAVYDDGSGPALFAGGAFWAAGGLGGVYRIARWDGSAWSKLTGPSGTGADDFVSTLAVYDDGSGPALYVGGYFTSAGGRTVNRVAKWDGSAWFRLESPSGVGTSDWVCTLAVYDDGSGSALYVGGYFATAGGVTVNHIARWNGSTWSAIGGPSGTGTNRAVLTLAVYDDGSGPALYAGGDFATAGGVIANHVARWDGSAWSGLSEPSGVGASDEVYALAVYDDGSGPALYAGGALGAAGGAIVDGVGKWDGHVWSGLGGPSAVGVNGEVYALAVYDDGSGPALYAGGSFTTAGGSTVNHIARWDGTTWSGLGGPSAVGVDDDVYSLAAYDDGGGPVLYAGGWFETAGGLTVNGIARWDGTTWSRLIGPAGVGVDDAVDTLAVYDDGSGPALYVGGWFDTAGGVTVNHIARWNGSAWSGLSNPSGPDPGTSGRVLTLAVYDDGSGPALYVGGWFTSAGGVIVNRIARWDGNVWSGLDGPSATGVDDDVYDLAAHDDGNGPALYAGGAFTSAGGVTVNRVARWNGSAWTGLSGPSAMGVDGAVDALAQYDDGSGPTLYAGGDFISAGGLLSSNIAAWRCSRDQVFADDFESASTAAWSVTVP